jgi:peptide/nickel transport system substrate-binding protein
MLSEWTPGKIILDANPSYFEGRPHIDRVVFKKFEDQKRAWTSLMQGSTDVVFDIDQEDFSVIKDDKRFTTYEYLDTFCFALIFNTRSEPFSSSELRKAISFAIDKNDLVSKALLGGGVATTGPFPPGSWAYNPDPSIQAFDPQKAGKLLADLGWVDTDGDWIREKNGQKLQFTVLINDNDKLQEATAKRLQWQLLQAGIRLDVKILPIAELVPNHLLNGNFQATIVNLNTMDNPDRMSSTFWDSSSIGAFNMSAYSNPEVDRLIRIGRTTSADKGKATIYQRIHKLLASDAPAVFLYFKKRYTALSGRLHGFQAGQTSQIGISFINWYISGASQKEGR